MDVLGSKFSKSLWDLPWKTTGIPCVAGCRERAWPQRVGWEDIGAWGPAIPIDPLIHGYHEHVGIEDETHMGNVDFR